MFLYTALLLFDTSLYIYVCDYQNIYTQHTYTKNTHTYTKHTHTHTHTTALHLPKQPTTDCMWRAFMPDLSPTLSSVPSTYLARSDL